jgi:hypothetical protein
MALNERQKQRLIGVVEKFNSDDEAERAFAAKQVAEVAKAQNLPIADLMFICFCSDKFIKHHMFIKPVAQPVRQFVDEWDDEPKFEIIDHLSLISEMETLLDIFGTRSLTSWEVNFSSDILLRNLTYLSEKQEACVRKIVAKLRRCEEDAF